jgi:ferrochelatase
MSTRKKAIILFNLGGPDSPDAVKPFLFNLFNDVAIIGLPNPFRWMLAKFIAWRRTPTAQHIYAQIGGASPILSETQKQSAALQDALGDAAIFRVFTVMRYWRPQADEVAEQVKEFAPDDVVLLPLYPQFSTTTTGSSFKDWHRAARRQGINVPTRLICCYPTQTGWAQAQADALQAKIESWDSAVPYRVLFSAHGLPEKTIAAGDPYQWQIEQSAAAIAAAANLDTANWMVCYQSRVGPLKWIGPSLDTALAQAAEDKVAVIVLPIAFVSEHSETLVELDIEYAERAKQLDVPGYHRVPAIGAAEPFITGLAEMVKSLSDGATGIGPDHGSRRCPAQMSGCLCLSDPAEKLGN